MQKKTTYALIAVIVIGIFAALIFLNGNSSIGTNGTALAKYDNVPLSQQALAKLHPPSSIFSSVGIGAGGNYPHIVNATPILYDGKPAVIYVGADYCPFCAAERWALVIALSRFGNFSELHYMTSSASDAYQNTPTFTFYNSTYYSPYISFVEVEETTNKLNAAGTGYPILQVPTPLENATFYAFDQNASWIPQNERGGIPFIDLANYSVVDGANYEPTIIDWMNWSTILSNFNNVNSSTTQAIIGSANLLTAQICNIDNNQPASVCGQPYIQNLKKATS